MNLGKYEHIVCSLAAGGLLLVGLFLLLNEAPQIARANPGDLFASSTGSGDCSQPSPCHLQTALSTASNGDAIYVATGTYTGAGEAVITVTKSITLYGGWDGTTTTPVVRDPKTYPTTLDGEGQRRVVYISENIAPTLDGFIVTGGNASNALANAGHGGGIYSYNANPIITNNVITNNIAYTSTTSFGFGGGFYLESASASALVSGNLIIGNATNPIGRGKGGGLAMYHSAAIVSSNTFQDNVAGSTANSQGGGLYLYSSPTLVSKNLFRDNKASSSSSEGFGGGFYTQFGAVTLSGNTIVSNAAQYGAVTFQHNTNVTLTNNIIAQNPAGGVFIRGSASYPFAGILVHNTIAQNGQEGIYAGWYDSGYSTLTLTNNIIVSHTTGIYAYPDPNPNVVIATHTLFYGNGTDTDGSTITSTDEITGSDPLFIDPAGWDYHLQAGSPAINAGTAVPWLTADIDGDARPWPTGGNYDIGADEVHWRQIYLPLVLRSPG